MAETISTDADLLSSIMRFCAEHQLPPSTFGRLALSDGNLIPDLENGRSLTLKSARRVVAFMERYRPESAAA